MYRKYKNTKQLAEEFIAVGVTLDVCIFKVLVEE